MPSTSSGIFMLLFCASLTITYLLARQGYVRQSILWSSGLLVNSACFCLYTLSRPIAYADALLFGIFLALIFTSGSILLGQFFKALTTSANEPAPRVLVAQKGRGEA